MVLDLGCGTQLLTCGYSALALAATRYRRCYASTFATDNETRLVLFAQKFAPLILHHRITTRIVNVPSSKRGSIRFEWKCAAYFQNRPARNPAVADKSPLNFGGPLLPKSCLIPVALSNGAGASGSYQSRQ
jgi:hypothetical protein